MFRKILIAVVASLALLAPFAMPSVSDAHPAPVAHRYHRPIYRPAINCWRVYYRTSCNSPWLYQGTYSSYLSAQCAAQSMPGFETMIR